MSTPPQAAASPAPAQAPAPASPAPALPAWLRLVSRLPLPALYVITALLSFIAHRIIRHRVTVVRDNIAGCFPQLPAAARRRIARGFHANLAQVLAETVKAATLDPGELARRVRFANLALAQEILQGGSPVVLVASHQCNWEWLLMGASLQLGFPLDAAYKPLHSAAADRVMLALRSRFGGRLIPAKELLITLIRSRGARGIALLADQVPMTSEFKWWTRFLGRPTAFYMGPEKIAQALRAAVIFASMRRTARGCYEVQFQLLCSPRERLQPGVVTERYVRALETSLLASPPDWMWSHRRWKLKPQAGAVDLEHEPSP
ncbi:MAG TPA: lysophospholipid acyltransferase family protein [Steroidobacteraceae bacterium]|nr:lysophospholipid acyltransferase family protein [Steroidobacteraceae bacterium]